MDSINVNANKADSSNTLRPSWQDYFVKVTMAIAERSTCSRGKPACIFVKGKRILSTGYAGSPPNFPHCSEVGHDMEERVRFIPTDGTAMPENFFKMLGYDYNYLRQRYEKPATQHCIRTIHAEQNAILQAARFGISLQDSIVYVTMTPCLQCTASIISVGVKEVIAFKRYHAGQESINMFKLANIPITHLDDSVETYL